MDAGVNGTDAAIMWDLSEDSGAGRMTVSWDLLVHPVQ